MGTRSRDSHSIQITLPFSESATFCQMLRINSRWWLMTLCYTESRNSVVNSIDIQLHLSETTKYTCLEHAFWAQQMGWCTSKSVGRNVCNCIFCIGLVQWIQMSCLRKQSENGPKEGRNQNKQMNTEKDLKNVKMMLVI